RIALQRLDDRLRADVGVGALDAAEHVFERAAVVHVAQLVAGAHELLEPVHDVVAADDADLHPTGESFRTRLFEYTVAAGGRIHTARIRNDADVLLDDVGQDLAHERYEVARVALRRVTHPLLLHDRHRDFRQVIEHQVVDRPAPHLFHGRGQAVAPEALARRYTDLFHVLPSSPHGPRCGPELCSAVRRARPSTVRVS